MDTSALIDRIKDVLLAYTFLQNYDPEKSTLIVGKLLESELPSSVDRGIADKAMVIKLLCFLDKCCPKISSAFAWVHVVTDLG
ncbi:hypothetical protein L596_001790 [Steinernema carpocapsae]|uniref:Uncharacterized protein n=1 Tax=Steinernema carpocapsae TaxID=34508 RepID=A0A4U8UM54_STECR|nr:hypothetical protein L596_001790 [Steinernema carpocapsae]